MRKFTLFILFLFPYIAFCQSISDLEIESEGIFYQLDFETKTATVVSVKTEYSGFITIPEKVQFNDAEYVVTKIGERAFSYMYDVEGIELPISLKEIASYAFEGCWNEKFTELTLPESLEMIDYFTCFYYTNIQTLKILGNIKTQGYALPKDTFIPINKLIFGPNVSDINSGICSLPLIQEFEVSLENLNYIVINGIIYDKQLNTLIQYPKAKKGDFTLPASVKNINSMALSYSSITEINVEEGNINFCSENGLLYNRDQSTLIQCPGLKSGKIIISEKVKNIEEYAFQYCEFITQVNIPPLVEVIPNRLFTNCSSLEEINIESGYLQRIESDAFAYCSSLQSFTIPESVKFIGGSCFYFCTSLKSMIIPNSVEEIEGGLFMNCESLESLEILAPLKETGWGLCFECNSLKNIKLPETLTNIREYCFAFCDRLTTITIPKNVTMIGENSFSNCLNLKEVICLSWMVPTINFNTFFNNDTQNKLYVYNDVLEDYMNSDWAQYFAEILPLDDAGVESLLANPDTKISIYSTDGILIKKDCKVEDLKTLNKGIYIIVSGKDRYKISI